MFTYKTAIAALLVLSATLPAQARGLHQLVFPDDPQVLVANCTGPVGAKNSTPQCKNFRMLYERELSACMEQGAVSASAGVGSASAAMGYKSRYLICSKSSAEGALQIIY